MSHCSQKLQCPGRCECHAVVEAEEAASAAVTVPVGDCEGGVALGSTEELEGPQIEETGTG